MPFDPPSDRDVLIALHCATGGASWGDNTNWLTDEPFHDWYGVTAAGDTVTRINLYNNDLTGTMPTELGNLSSLTVLVLDLNDLTGTIPSELGNLGSMTIMYLSENDLTGAIPSELGDLTRLQYLFLYDNELTGEIPSELGNLTRLRYLYLDSNKLTGEVPEFSESSRLSSVYLNDNPQLSGRLPLDPMVHTDMSSLHIENTRICVPDTPEFQQWLMGISFADSGIICGEEIILPPPPIVPIPPEQQPEDLGPVTGVEVTEELRQLSVSWDRFPEASGYRVQWKSGAQDFDESTRQHTVTSGSTTTYTIPNLTAGTPYTIRVIAIVSDTESMASEEVTGTPFGEELRPIPGTEQRSGGGCAIGSVVPGEVSQSALFNMLVVMSALFAASRRKNKTKLERRKFLDDSH